MEEDDMNWHNPAPNAAAPMMTTGKQRTFQLTPGRQTRSYKNQPVAGSIDKGSKAKALNVRMAPEVFDLVAALAHGNNVSMSSYIAQIMHSHCLALSSSGFRASTPSDAIP